MVKCYTIQNKETCENHIGKIYAIILIAEKTGKQLINTQIMPLGPYKNNKIIYNKNKISMTENRNYVDKLLQM